LRDEEKSKEQLINEPLVLRQGITELEASRQYDWGQFHKQLTAACKTWNYKISDLLDIPLLQQMFASFLTLPG
jgi:hypothetical protein